MLRFSKAEKIFPAENSKWHFGPVSLDIQEGEFVAVMGRSGSGKSTFLHLAGGILRPDSGEITFHEENINTFSDKELAVFRNQHIGFVFQDFFLIHEFTLLENVAMPLFLRKKSTKEAFDISAKTIEKVGLRGKEKSLPRELSGGQRQRAAIARAIVTEPDLLLTDEPTGNLDAKTGEEIIELLAHLHQNKKMALVLVTHDEQIAQKANRCITIADGKLIL